jgi:hypothetical protein
MGKGWESLFFIYLIYKNITNVLDFLFCRNTDLLAWLLEVIRREKFFYLFFFYLIYKNATNVFYFHENKLTRTRLGSTRLMIDPGQLDSFRSTSSQKTLEERMKKLKQEPDNNNEELIKVINVININ